MDAITHEDGAEFKHAASVKIPGFPIPSTVQARVEMMASELDGFFERESFVAGNDFERIFDEDFVTEFALEAIDDFGIRRDIEGDDFGAWLEFDTEEDGTEVETNTPVAGDVGTGAERAAVLVPIRAFFFAIAEAVAVFGPRPIA